MAFDGSLVVIMEVVSAIAEADFAQMLPPVTTITPLPPFTWVAKQGPAFEFVKEVFGYPVEDRFGTTAATVVGPAPDDGIELANQAGLRSAAIFTDELFQVKQMALLGFLTRFDDSFEAGLTAI